MLFMIRNQISNLHLYVVYIRGRKLLLYCKNINKQNAKQKKTGTIHLSGLSIHLRQICAKTFI